MSVKETDTVYLCDEDEVAKEHAQHEAVRMREHEAVHMRDHQYLTTPDPEDEDEEEEEEEEEEDDTFQERTWWTLWQTRHCAICVYLFLSVVLLASTVAIVLTGALVVAPYRKVSAFLPALCLPFSVDVDQIGRKCSCGKGCTSRYPCVRIHVTYTHHKLSPQRALLYENEAALDREVRKNNVFNVN